MLKLWIDLEQNYKKKHTRKLTLRVDTATER